MATSDRSEPDPGWLRKGGTLSDKTARKEYGLTQVEILDAIRDGRLHYREGSVFGNIWLRLLRSEVEALVRGNRGSDVLRDWQASAELARIDLELKQLRAQVAALEVRRTQLRSERGR